MFVKKQKFGVGPTCSAMNFDTSVRGCVTTNLDRFDVGNVYRDDAEKLHSDLIGINAIALEDALEDAMDVAAASENAKASAAASNGADNDGIKTETSSSIDFLKQQVGMMRNRISCL